MNDRYIEDHFISLKFKHIYNVHVREIDKTVLYDSCVTEMYVNLPLTKLKFMKNIHVHDLY